MKRTPLTVMAALAVFLAAGSLAGGPDAAGAPAPEKVSVPLSNPDKPCSVIVDVYLGSITIKAVPGREVIVEAVGRDQILKTRRDKVSGVPADEAIEDAIQDALGESRESMRLKQEKDETKRAGLKKLNLAAGLGLEIREENNEVRIETESQKRAVDLTIQVPFNCTLKLECYAGGDIVVERVNGEMDIECYAGSVYLTDVSGAGVKEPPSKWVVLPAPVTWNTSPKAYARPSPARTTATTARAMSDAVIIDLLMGLPPVDESDSLRAAERQQSLAGGLF